MQRRHALSLLSGGLLVAIPGLPLRAASVEDTIQRVKPSIVAVGSYERLRSPPFVFRGTGFAVADGTLIVTNAHVVPAVMDADRIEVLAIAIPGAAGEPLRRRDARVVAIDRDHDLAVLRIPGTPLPVLSLSTGDIPREGQGGAFTGFPVGGTLGLVPVTHRAMVGAITPNALPGTTAGDLEERVVRRLQGGTYQLLQLDALAYPGNSGSPLYDPNTGEVFGVITLAFVRAVKDAPPNPGPTGGIGFAVPVQYLRPLLAGIK